jgi:hypothetical protein
MKSLLLALTASFGFLAPTWANDQFTILIPNKPGGLANIQADTLKSAAAIKKINIDIEFAGSCQNAARILKQSKPVVAILGTHIYADSRCNFDKITKEQFLTYLQQQPSMVCHKKDRTELNTAHFQDPHSKKSLAVISFFKGVVDTLVAEQKQNNVRVISVGVSNDIKAQTFLNEFDYFLLDTDYATKNTDRLTCIANTGGREIFGVPALKNVWTKPSSSNEFYISHLLITNQPNADSTRKIFGELVDSETWAQYLSKQNGVTVLPKNVDQLEYLTVQSRLLAQ